MKMILRSRLPDGLEEAVSVTESSLPNSHCPHSGLSVAAGLVLDDGSVATGVNYESDSYGLTLCAERAVLARAQAEQSLSRTRCLVLAARWRDRPEVVAEPLSPCGACRQWLAELSVRLGRDFPVYSFWAGSEQGLEFSARSLLPAAFGLHNE